jgi:hydroxypyruvate isomerase
LPPYATPGAVDRTELLCRRPRRPRLRRAVNTRSLREFRDNIDVTLGIGEALGVRGFNALYGNRVSDATPEQQDDLAVENLTLAAKAVAPIGGTILVEPVSGPKPYPLRTAGDVVAVLDRVPAPNVGLLCDLFHLANNGDDIDAALAAYGGRIAHVQIADHPGRGEPGSGTLDLDRYLNTIRASATPATSHSNTFRRRPLSTASDGCARRR